MRKQKKQKHYNDNLKPLLKGRVFVAIDAANLEKSAQDLRVDPMDVKRGVIKNLQWHVDYKKLLSFFKKNSRLKRLSFYTASFKTKSHNDFLLFLKSNGYKVVAKPVKEIKDNKGVLVQRKANFDVEIAVDALDTLDQFDTFVLFSGDSDFAYLVNYLKTKGKKTVIISTRWHIARELIESADVYKDIYKLRRRILRLTHMPKTRP